MYTSHIGKRFIDIYNRRTGNNLTAKEFFETVYFPLFYDDPRYLQHIGNAPFAQLVNQHKHTDPKERKAKLTEVIAKINDFTRNKNRLPDMSFAVGATSMDMSLGQVTNLILPFDADDVYGSWIGSGLAIGVKSGDKANLSFVIDEEEILWCLYEGWQEYRKYLDQTPVVKDKQIETWNGHWIQHRLLNSGESYTPPIEEQNGAYSIPTASWVEIMFSLSNRFPKEVFTASVFGLGQQNTTMGFIQFHLQEIGKPFQIYQQLFGKVSGIKTMELAKLYQTEFGFLRACQNGSIGLRQLEPKDLKKYMPGGEKLPTIKDYEKSQITFSIYLTWIIAMLNNKEFLELAIRTASTLHKYVAGGDRSKKTRPNEVEAVINAKSKKEFAASLTPIIENAPDVAEEINKTLDMLHLDVSADNVMYFITLLRFKYALPESILNTQVQLF